MDAAPEHMTAQEADASGRYRCPLCGAPTSTTKERDSGWVFCPMLDNRIICLGCCLDYQYLARSEHFAKHPSREDFDRLAEMTGKTVSALRLICMQHQESVLVADLEQARFPELEREMRELLNAIRVGMKTIDDELD